MESNMSADGPRPQVNLRNRPADRPHPQTTSTNEQKWILYFWSDTDYIQVQQSLWSGDWEVGPCQLIASNPLNDRRLPQPSVLMTSARARRTAYGPAIAWSVSELYCYFICAKWSFHLRKECVREKTADASPRSTATAVRTTLGETSMFIVRVLHSTDLGLTEALLNNRTKTLLLYDFIIQCVKYWCNNHDLDDIFTNTSTVVKCKYWLLVTDTLESAYMYFGGWKKIFILWPGHKSPPQLFGQDFVINFSTYKRVYGN